MNGLEMAIKDSVRKLYEANKLLRDTQAYVTEVRNKEQLCISNYMFSVLPKGEESFIIDLDEGVTYYKNPLTVRVTKVRRRTILWKLERLKEKLSKEQQEMIIDKTYTVNDMPGLISYLKACGVDPKKFKKYIHVESKVNDEKLESACQLGKIRRSELDGCYSVTLGESYIRLTECRKTI